MFRGSEAHDEDSRTWTSMRTEAAGMRCSAGDWATRVVVIITAYALGRMRQRDIDQSEVLEVLAAPRSAHGSGKGPGRHEVAWETDRGRLWGGVRTAGARHRHGDYDVP